jgi:hypothetical protein
MLSEVNDLRHNPFFIDLMLRRLLMRAAMLEQSAGLDDVLSDSLFVEIMAKQVDDYPAWLFTDIKETDYEVLNADSTIGIRSQERVNANEQDQSLKQDLLDKITEEIQAYSDLPVEEASPHQSRRKPSLLQSTE